METVRQTPPTEQTPPAPGAGPEAADPQAAAAAGPAPEQAQGAQPGLEAAAPAGPLPGEKPDASRIERARDALTHGGGLAVRGTRATLGEAANFQDRRFGTSIDRAGKGLTEVGKGIKVMATAENKGQVILGAARTGRGASEALRHGGKAAKRRQKLNDRRANPTIVDRLHLR